MTPKQIERIQNKIKRLKAALAKDKKYWGGYYHDGQGVRYMIPRLYIQIEDYKGGQRYFDWFDKNFPDDSGYPDFFFEWAIVLFMNGKTRESEKKLFETYCRNVYIIDEFLGKKIMPIGKEEGSNLEAMKYTEYLNYSSTDENLKPFSLWLKDFIMADKFLNVTKEFLELEEKLKNESNYDKRHYLISRQQQLINNF